MCEIMTPIKSQLFIAYMLRTYLDFGELPP